MRFIRFFTVLRAIAVVIGIAVALLAIATYRTTATSSIGYPGVAMQVTESREVLSEKWAENQIPPALPPASDRGANAAESYENVQVLGHLSTAQFTRLMTAITTWVSPNEGCAYCHNTENMASDEVYQKVVSRRMIQMVWHVNENWQSHVQETGVTCYTCHRGQGVPQYAWATQPEDATHGLGNRAYQNAPSTLTGLSSLPQNAFETYLAPGAEANIRVQSGEPLPGGNRSSIKQTEWTYALMMHFSGALGVNCTFCHNSRSWADWSQSPVQRTTAWYGIRMVRNVNQEYIESLDDVFPEGAEGRRGPLGDLLKVNCATCHQGAYRPFLGESMLGDYPTLAASPEHAMTSAEVREQREAEEAAQAAAEAQAVEDSLAEEGADAEAAEAAADADDPTEAGAAEEAADDDTEAVE
ncbi:MAG: photosynthetic reaction center cytochrome PufC [Sandaracinaceae bacterium]